MRRVGPQRHIILLRSGKMFQKTPNAMERRKALTLPSPNP